MTPPLSYLEFHLLFVLPPIVGLLAMARYRSEAWLDRQSTIGLVVIIGLAVVYTTPWDNLLIEEGVWWYGDSATVGTIWAAPIGEYLFFVLQPILTGLFLYQLSIPTHERVEVPLAHRLLGGLGGIAITVVGWLLLTGRLAAVLSVEPQSTFYLGAILVWAGPILIIQWAFGLTFLWRNRRPLAVAVAVPTLYLWIADWAAIAMGIWVISDVHTTGLTLVGLPIEEAVFFLITNVFVVQGLVLYRWLIDAWPQPVADFLPGDSRLAVPQWR